MDVQTSGNDYSCNAFLIVPNCYRDHHAKLEIDKTGC